MSLFLDLDEGVLCQGLVLASLYLLCHNFISDSLTVADCFNLL